MRALREDSKIHGYKKEYKSNVAGSTQVKKCWLSSSKMNANVQV